ncbi:LptF/LptG family permease [Flavivirga rizhaonensis]|uniref:YjgP/YjgQ family permease n=1 Tax=Flavivirga rizhaonensis TaxID=2559571 RepID=A0A4S1E2J6_9FLAO|nr:LptF/LptG family permease [Flavivirga rizhaonensis]TGV04625.1 YjgP/YjgQ family permease [Flavivirga rizhaonensis]
MKILDRYILTTYLKTFISVFVILMLIFILQTIWLYIKELAGKDLDIVVIAKFLIYFMPKLIPLVLPLTILLASIMVFGSFAENYEFAAMKSTGISLQRAMSGLSVFIVVLGFVTFLFSNNVIPWAEYNILNLRINIKNTKPAMAIAEGQFNPIGDDFNIKVDKKSGDNDQILNNVTIHIKGGSRNRLNLKTIKSKTGELVSKKNSNTLKLILFDGNYYEDLLPKTPKAKNKKPFVKSTFEKYIINIDLSDFNKVDFDKKSQTDKYSMLNISSLNKTIDSLTEKRQNDYQSFSKNLFHRSGVSKNIRTKATKKSISNDSINTDNLFELFSPAKKSELVVEVEKSITSAKQIVISKEKTRKNAKILVNKHIISLHEKFALGFACIILFFVGAPLGALIRKGGIGLPMVIAILLFLTYHFIGIFATNSAKSGNLNPILASWFSTLMMLPLGVFLTKRATEDRGIFELGNIIEPLKKVLNIKEKDAVDYKFLSPYKNEELYNLINNYETLGHDENIRYEAIKLLNSRGLSIKQIRENGVHIDDDYDVSEHIAKKYKNQAKFAIISYSIGAVLLILYFICNNNKLPSLASILIKISIGAFILFAFYYVRLLISTFKFYTHIKKKDKKPDFLLLLIGLPLYIISFAFLNVKIKEDLKLNCLNSLK